MIWEKSKAKALVQVSLEIREGEIISIVGESGSGKSTLLNLLSTIDRPTAGTVEYNGKRIDSLNQKTGIPVTIGGIWFCVSKV